MKYDPVSLFDIVLYEIDNDYQLDIAPSKEMLQHCTAKLNAQKDTDSYTGTAEEMYAIVAAAIIEYAHLNNRKN